MNTWSRLSGRPPIIAAWIMVSALLSVCGPGAAFAGDQGKAAADADWWDDDAGDVVEASDPIEPVNRAFFVVNDRLYFYVFRPVARAYNRVAPEPVRRRVQNFFSNVAMPVRFVNCLLQAKFVPAGRELGRFAVNTTLGVLGFGDPARTRLGWQPQEEDLGQTLAVWGIPDGPYIDWPVLGPSTVKDTVGWVGDLFLDPLHYLDVSRWAKVGVHGYENLNDISLHLGEYEKIKRASLDPYIAVRDGYVQMRQSLVEQ